MAPSQMTWKEMAAAYPEAVQWMVQEYGPLPDGPIDWQQYGIYRAAYLEYLKG